VVLKRAIKVSDDVLEKIEMLREKWGLGSPNQVLKRLLSDLEQSHLGEKDHARQCNSTEILKELLNACIAKKAGEAYIIDCRGKKAFVGEKALIDLVKRFGLNILVE
jgi:hypothetical protein